MLLSYHMALCMSGTFGRNLLCRDRLLKRCLIKLRSVKAGQEDCLPCNEVHRPYWLGSDSTACFRVHGHCHTENLAQISEAAQLP